ncbi:restriction endonuclease subunit S [Collinsella ihumii]|uniref:Restriction endonuclease subunit S n=1 Tax=Collinsella ihumii TaxID=1720204 RepID=A0AAW7JRE3_9ACTN|nr:restriction endonuclease subunit S [Collinsella ihumii]MDN0069715.1 restriction endonuclease subunit S [Collinsella ihumii]
MIETTLGALSIGGGSYGIGASAVEYSSELPTYLRITDIRDDGTLDLSSRKSVSDPKASEYMLQEGDIVFARTGNSTGRNYYYDPRDGEFAYAGFLIKFSLNPSLVNPRYIKYYAQSKPYWDWIASFNTGSTRGNINAKTYEALPIALPPRDVQDSIVAFCDSISNKMRVNQRTNDYLEQCALALYKDKLEFFDDALPVGWSWHTLSEFFPVRTGKKDANAAVEGGEYPFFTCSQLATRTDSYSFEGDAILVAGNGNFNVKWYRGKFDAYQRTYVLIPENGELLGWLYCAVKRNLEFITQGARGSVIKFITKGNIADYRIAVPQNVLTNEYVKQLNQLLLAIEAGKREIDMLSDLRDYLLPKLMSGELDVSEINLPAQPNNHLSVG